MKTVLAVITVLILAVIANAADSLTVTTINQSQRIDTIKARLVAPSWSYNCPDTMYLKRNGLVRLRLQWINPGNAVIVDTTVIWRPSEVGVDTYRFTPHVRLSWPQN